MNDLTPEVAWVYELQWPGTNEIYIGSTSQHPEKRFKDHHGRPRKCYEHLGIENAKLGFCYPYTPKHNWDRDEEIRWKKISRNYGYTVLDGGDRHGAPLRMSDESKCKVSASNKRRWSDPEERRKLSEAMNRPEYIRKQRQANGKPFTVTWPDGCIKQYLGTCEAAADLGVGRMTVRRYLKGMRIPGGNKRTAHLKGCIFQYV